MIKLDNINKYNNKTNKKCENDNCNELATHYVVCSGDAFNGNYGWAVYGCLKCIKRYNCLSHFK